MRLFIIHNFYMIYIFFLKNPKVINELIKGRTYLHYACDYGQKEILEYLILKGANINVSILYFKIKCI